jgi:hypothetical protein
MQDKGNLAQVLTAVTGFGIRNNSLHNRKVKAMKYIRHVLLIFTIRAFKIKAEHPMMEELLK